MNRWAILAAGLVVGVVLSTALYVMAAPGRVVPPARIGVVDFARLVKESREMKDAEKAFNAERDRLTKEAERRVRELKELQKKLVMHVKESPAYRQTIEQIEKKQIDNVSWYEVKMRGLIDRRNVAMEAFYRKTLVVTTEYATANGLSLVLKVDRIEQENASPEEFRRMVRLKQVLYVANNVDITTDIRVRLDTRHLIRKTGGR